MATPPSGSPLQSTPLQGASQRQRGLPAVVAPLPWLVSKTIALVAIACFPLFVYAAVGRAADQSGGSVHSWASKQIEDTIRVGLFNTTPARFRPESPIRAGALAHALGVVNVDQNSAPSCATTGPTISGIAQAGQTLTASPGDWTGSPASFAYQWQTSTDDSTWSDLQAAASSAYAVQTSDVGNYLRVEVIASNANGPSPPAYSAATSQVLPDGATGTPTAPTTTPVCPQSPLPKPTYTPHSGSARLTVRRLDDILVHYLGLDTAAAQLRSTLKSSGLNPPAWAGTESIARILGLQVTLAQPDQHLETELGQPATRAETAYALDQIYHFTDREPDHIQSIVTALQPTQTNLWQERILNEALHFIGTPYIWGGNTEWGPQYLFGQKVPGGFDCSGFVRRVYVLQHYPGSGKLNDVLHGRTTYVMAAVPRSQRIYKKPNLEPGDVMFFGDGRHSSTSEIDHTGIYVGNNWLINSSGNGVTLTPLAGWLHSSFAWAERPLRVAGLSR